MIDGTPTRVEPRGSNFNPDTDASYDCCTYDDTLVLIGPRIIPEASETLRVMGMFSELVFPQPNMRGQNTIMVGRPLFTKPHFMLKEKIASALKSIGVTSEHFGMGVIFRDRNLVPARAFYAQHCRLDVAEDTIELLMNTRVPMDRVRLSCREVLVWEAALNPAFTKEPT